MLSFLKQYFFSTALFSVYFCFSVTRAQTCGLARYYEAQTDKDYDYYITSPNYPSYYPSSTTCEWTITAPSGYVVELSFVTFDTGNLESGSCSDISTDVLEIYEGTYLRGEYCKSYLPANVYSSTGGSLYLKFTSDKYLGGEGFKIRYSAVKPKPDSTICSPFNTFSQNNNIQLSSSSGYIESPLYGSKYPSNMQCTWVITVREGFRIKLTFSNFMLEKNSHCSADSPSGDNDQLQIRDGRYSYGSSLETLCGQTLPSTVYSSGRYMWIRFKSNSNNYNTRSRTGFKAKYEEEVIIISSRTDSDSSDIDPVVILLIVCGAVSLVCICICIARRRRTTHRDNVRDPGVAQTTLTNDRQTPSAPSYPTVHYSPALQSSYPPPSSGYPPPTQDSNQQPPPAGSYPMSTTGDAGDTTQPSAPTRDHSSSTFLNDPPPTYPEAVLDVPPPPYPGIVSQDPQQAMNMTTPI